MKKSPVGTALIFTAFAVIMLASLAALALSTANADLALTNRAENAVIEYYSLDMMAQERLAKLNEGETAEFEITGESMTLHVSAKNENNKLEIEKYRLIPNQNGEYGGNILELWDGK